jgi:hypothetical protein
VLDLTTPVYPHERSKANIAIPCALYTTQSDLALVRYITRSSAASAAHAAPDPLATFRFLDLDHPTLQHPSGVVGATHATPVEWHVSEVDDTAVQLLPHLVPFLQGQQLCAYMAAPEETKVFRGLPAVDAQQQAIMADALVYSAVQHVCLVFSAVVQVRPSLRCTLSGTCERLMPSGQHVQIESQKIVA